MTRPESCDVVVIGGGLVGASAALHLAQRRLDVVLLERGAVGNRASGLNFGGVRRNFRQLVELPLAARAREIWGRLDELVGSECEFRATGHVYLAQSDEEMASLAAFAQAARSNEMPVTLLDGADMRRRYDWIGPTVIGGCLAPDDGCAMPALVAPAFARAAREAGALVLEGAPLVDITHDGDEFTVTTATGRQFCSSHVINAAGPGGAAIAARFGEKVPAELRAPQMTMTAPLAPKIAPVIGCRSAGFYLRQLPTGHVLFGGGYGALDADGIGAAPRPEVLADTHDKVARLIPHLRDVAFVRAWAGVEPYMPDNLPIIGPSATTQGLLHAFGFSGHGFQLGPGVGAVLADLVIHQRTATPIDAFRVDRFSPSP